MTESLDWRRARCDSAACLEIAHHGGRTLLRDSTDPDGAWLVFSTEAWREFIDGIRSVGFEPV
jgi:hypothetical protein